LQRIKQERLSPEGDRRFFVNQASDLMAAFKLR
jgi:hypothetical protein